MDKTQALKLWIDDRRSAPDSSWTVARTSREAIAIFAAGRVAQVSFDCDLGGPDTGMAVVAWLERRCFEDPDFPMPAYTVHSANPPEAERVRVALKAIVDRREQR
jgi:hypothetical protein